MEQVDTGRLSAHVHNGNNTEMPAMRIVDHCMSLDMKFCWIFNTSLTFFGVCSGVQQCSPDRTLSCQLYNMEETVSAASP